MVFVGAAGGATGGLLAAFALGAAEVAVVAAGVPVAAGVAVAAGVERLS